MKKNLLSVLILVLMIVNIAMSAVMMISVTSTNKKTAALMDSIATAMNLEWNSPGSTTDVPLSDSETYVVGGGTGTMTVLLAFSQVEGEDGTVSTSSRQTYIVFDIALLLNKSHEDYEAYGGDNMSQYDSIIKDTVEGVVKQYTEEQCRADFSGVIRDEILAAIQKRLNSKIVYGITLNNVKYGSG